ncbi:uncharacterized protein LOC117222911 [Megalopta genalis]|uniref:uncharacterized protein LOC117222911 n=1 Tax=Megalopta genalis TaxID=115081 RepID=UPI003FD0E3A4
MALKISNINIRNLQSSKKRKIEMNDTLNVELNNTSKSDEVFISIENIKKENEQTPIKKECDNNSQIDYYNNERKTNESNGDNRTTRSAKKSLISIRKIEDLCKTPIKNEILKDSIYNNSIKKEELCSPIQYTPSILTTYAAEWNSNNTQESQEISTPIKKRKSYFEQSNIPPKQSKREISDDAEYNQFFDSIKTELCDDTVNDTDHIKMLHDLDSVMDFDEIKITPDFLSSTINDMQDEDNMEISTNSQVDPLSINETDMHDIVIRSHKMHLRSQNIGITNNQNHAENETSSDSELDIEDKELSGDNIKRLYNFKVQLIHDVLPQHKIHPMAGVKSLTAAEKNLFLQYESLRQGPFLVQEDEIIKNNWETFCQVHNWNPKVVTPFICVKNGNKCWIRSYEERLKFIQYLANGLPRRLISSVYLRFRSLFKKRKKPLGRFIPEEDEIILAYMRKHGRRRKNRNHFFKLSQILGRHRSSIYKRYKVLRNMQSKLNDKPISEVKWTLQLIGKFIKSLLDLSLCDKVEELKDAIIPRPIWLQLEKKLDINLKVLKGFWVYQLHMQLFYPESIYLNDIKIKLIEYFYGKGISSNREIIWAHVTRYFEGATSKFLHQVFSIMVQQAAKSIGTTHLADVIEYLHDIKIPYIRDNVTDKFLPRFSYRDGNVQIIDEDGGQK